LTAIQGVSFVINLKIDQLRACQIMHALRDSPNHINLVFHRFKEIGIVPFIGMFIQHNLLA